MGLNSAQGHSGLTGLGLAPGPGLRPLASPHQPGTASARMTRSRHARPWPERARWRAHRRLNDGEDPEPIEGKWSLDLGPHATIRKPRRGGQEMGAHQGRRFCGGARTDWEEAPVRGRASGRGGRRCGRGGALWRRGACCRVGGLGKQSEKATTDEVLTDEDDGGGIPLPGVASRRCGQVLGAGGAR
jgi:hypothetical protein